ncbi:MAG: hypothetical protein ACUVWY_14315, partial [Desulfosoma sp.]|uniref:hypothetical protein n=1 Tax=Desulfosoma sp. TaxID=2603217 RepID=UPI00404ACA26
ICRLQKMKRELLHPFSRLPQKKPPAWRRCLRRPLPHRSGLRRKVLLSHGALFSTSPINLSQMLRNRLKPSLRKLNRFYGTDPLRRVSRRKSPVLWKSLEDFRKPHQRLR